MKMNTAEQSGQKIRLPEKLGFGAFAMSLDAATNFMSTFLLFFLTDVFGLSPLLAGTVLMIGTVWDGVNDPCLGYFAINHRFKNNEVSRPYAKWFALPTALMFILLFTCFDIPQNVKFIYATVIYLVYDTFNTFLRIPSGSMATLATRNVKDRISINVFVSGGSSVGVILATLGCWPLINALSGVNESGRLINPRFGFLVGATIVAVILLAGSLLHYATTRERILPEPGTDHKIGVVSALKLLFSCREWVENTVYMLFYNIGILCLTASMAFYSTHVLQDPGSMTLIMAAYILATMVALPFINPIYKRLGRKKTMMLAAALLILSKIYFVISPRSMAAAMVNGLLVGVGVAFSIVMFSLNRADVADIIDWRHGKRMENMISTVASTVSKLAMAVSNFAIGLVLEWSGYSRELAVQPEGALRAIESFMGIVPMIMAALMLVVAAKTVIEKTIGEMNGEVR